MYVEPDGSATLMSAPPDGCFHNLEAIAVPAVENGMPVTDGDAVCALAEEGMTCWKTETGHGAFFSSSHVTTF